jgi:phosphoesterase RecJ-like protein
MPKLIADKLLAANSIVLSTHRNSDGDGLGAQLALFHALKSLKKKVAIVNLDRPSRKYAFLGVETLVGIYGENPLPEADLALVLDTNDRRLVEPMITELEKRGTEVIFVDHHPVLKAGPSPNAGSHIDITAASTGEIAYRTIQELGVQLTPVIARALYTSVAFDTQLFRFVKSDPRSHLMAADLLKYEKNPEEIHRKLFATYTIQKMEFLARALAQVEYTANGKIALLKLDGRDIRAHGLDLEESADVIDMVMNIETVQMAALMREDTPGVFKLSLRSKGSFAVLPLAESLGGGGHTYAAGAYVKRESRDLREFILGELLALVQPGLRTANE